MLSAVARRRSNRAVTSWHDRSICVSGIAAGGNLPSAGRLVRHSDSVHHAGLVPRLTDDVVVLDAHRGGDLEAHLAGEDEETARRFGWWPERSTPETVTRTLREWSDDWALRRARRTFAVRSSADGRLVGGRELRLQTDGVTGQVSYWTNSDTRRRSYASRALSLLVAYAWSVGLSRLAAHIDPDNPASLEVSEHAGFVVQGTLVEDNQTQMLRYVRFRDT